MPQGTHNSNAMDIQTARDVGELTGQMAAVLDRLNKMDKKLDGVVAMTNRWKGATALLIVIGGMIGYLSNVALKMLGKA
jgi:hypothetical protein